MRHKGTSGRSGGRKLRQATCCYLYLCLLVLGLITSLPVAIAQLAGGEQHLRRPVLGNLTAGNGKQQQDESQPQQQQQQELPLYMRILATLACLIIFSVGICGNLLVPLVVIKTKYLRNSTNLFLINLSVADLLVLSVCMPTVLIELHSRPETWLLGEPMCKLSNFVEMLAANGSIFTILAISFERYYAICKPLKAGYKCTRLRATIIICIIWLLSSLLTSPILIMAKSSQTTYIDGSLVYNCILETDTYWHKMYVFISMIAFFCLPLLVLMLVYWLIGRRLIRENIAMGTVNTGSIGSGRTNASCINGFSFKTNKNKSFRDHLPTFLSLLNPKSHHQLYSLDGSSKKVLDNSKSEASSTVRRSMLSSNKTLSLDNHLMTRKKQQGKLGFRTYSQRSQAGNLVRHATKNTKININNNSDSSSNLDTRSNCQVHPESNQSLAKRIICRLFHVGHPKGKSLHNQETKPTSINAENSYLRSGDSVRIDGGEINNSVVSHTTGSDSSNDDQSSQTPFLSTFTSLYKTRQSSAPIKKGSKDRESSGAAIKSFSRSSYLQEKRCNLNRPKFSGWAKLGFSISSFTTSTQTNCTALPSEISSSAAPEPLSKLNLSISETQASPHFAPDNHHEPSEEESLTNGKLLSHNKKSARFQVQSATLIDDSGPRLASCSSMSDSYTTSPYTSKSPSPDSMSAQVQNQHLLEASGCGADAVAVAVAGQIQLNKTGACQSKAQMSFPMIEDESEIDYTNSKMNIEKLNAIQTANSCDYQDYLNKLRQQTNIDPLAEEEVNQEGTIRSNLSPEMDQFKGNSNSCKGKLDEIEVGDEDDDDDDDIEEGEFNNSRQQEHGSNTKCEKRFSQPLVCTYFQSGTQLSELMVIHDLSKKQQMDSRRQVVVMLAFVVACFFLLFFPYRVFTIWLILATEDQVQSLGMETYYNLTYFSRILIYLHSAINPIAYNLISTKFRRAFMSILLCRGSNSRRHFTTEHQAANVAAAAIQNKKTKGINERRPVRQMTSS